MREAQPDRREVEDQQDRACLRRHAGGDPEAFGELVTRHRDRAWAVALRTIGDPQEAEDAVQDAFLSALRGAPGYRGEARVSTWLHRIVVNAALDRVRRRGARATVPLDPAASEHLADPRDRLADSDRARDVADGLARLPDDQRIALVLCVLEDLPVTEVARLLDVPEGTVKSRCSRGRARLAELLAHLGPEGTAADDGASESRGTAEPPAPAPTPAAPAVPAAAAAPAAPTTGPGATARSRT